jgi:hypothetical protein
MIDSVYKSKNEKKMCVGGIFCANHEILLAKLHFCGIRGVFEDWFRSYLTNRREDVEVTPPNSTQNSFLCPG